MSFFTMKLEVFFSFFNKYHLPAAKRTEIFFSDNNSSFMRGWEKRFFAGKGFPGKLTDMHGQHRTKLA